mmetsp:Transcript_91693/g.259675  ORF Transcript_91693/g.259675 Transcript_91693/m.259675 type:complete len:452 (+) Transcript_91693:526-1881(+)
MQEELEQKHGVLPQDQRLVLRHDAARSLRLVIADARCHLILHVDALDKLEVVGHVRMEDGGNADFPRELVLMGGKPLEDIGGAVVANLEEPGAVHVLQRRGVVVEERQLVPDLEEELVCPPLVPDVVAERRNQQRVLLHVAEPGAAMDLTEEPVDCVANVQGVHVAVVGVVVVARPDLRAEALERVEVEPRPAGALAEGRVEEDVQQHLVLTALLDAKEVQLPGVHDLLLHRQRLHGLVVQVDGLEALLSAYKEGTSRIAPQLHHVHDHAPVLLAHHGHLRLIHDIPHHEDPGQVGEPLHHLYQVQCLAHVRRHAEHHADDDNDRHHVLESLQSLAHGVVELDRGYAVRPRHLDAPNFLQLDVLTARGAGPGVWSPVVKAPLNFHQPAVHVDLLCEARKPEREQCAGPVEVQHFFHGCRKNAGALHVWVGLKSMIRPPVVVLQPCNPHFPG